jgi:hypothetical protein
MTTGTNRLLYFKGENGHLEVQRTEEREKEILELKGQEISQVQEDIDLKSFKSLAGGEWEYRKDLAHKLHKIISPVDLAMRGFSQFKIGSLKEGYETFNAKETPVNVLINPYGSYLKLGGNNWGKIIRMAWISRKLRNTLSLRTKSDRVLASHRNFQVVENIMREWNFEDN